MDNNCKPAQKTGIKEGFSIGSISGVLKLITAAFSIPSEPAPALPPQLIFIGGKLRSGMSPSTIASRIISRQSQAGKVTGNVFADGPNSDEAMEVIRIEEIVNSLVTEMRIDVVVDPGIQVTTVGVGNLGIPIVSQGATVNLGKGTGVAS